MFTIEVSEIIEKDLVKDSRGKLTDHQILKKLKEVVVRY